MIDKNNLNKNVRALLKERTSTPTSNNIIDYFFEKSFRVFKKVYTVTVNVSLVRKGNSSH
jgi:hypothetical protein